MTIQQELLERVAGKSVLTSEEIEDEARQILNKPVYSPCLRIKDFILLPSMSLTVITQLLIRMNSPGLGIRSICSFKLLNSGNSNDVFCRQKFLFF